MSAIWKKVPSDFSLFLKDEVNFQMTLLSVSSSSPTESLVMFELATFHIPLKYDPV